MAARHDDADQALGGGGGVGKGAASATTGEERQFSHLGYEFLRPDKILDGRRRRPDHADYDPRTLHVPQSFMDKLTPAMRQWWTLKAQHYDVILFFKMGKFYELYHTVGPLVGLFLPKKKMNPT